jgi:DnaK suppressor protein
MDKQTMARSRDSLEERRAEIAREIESMSVEIRALGEDQDNENGSLGNHMAEDGSNVMEAERLSTISEDLRSLLNQIDGAFKRMDHGTFGICERCGKPINPERLEAFPYVAYCIECQSRIEREQALRAGR